MGASGAHLLETMKTVLGSSTSWWKARILNCKHASPTACKTIADNQSSAICIFSVGTGWSIQHKYHQRLTAWSTAADSALCGLLLHFAGHRQLNFRLRYNIAIMCVIRIQAYSLFGYKHGDCSELVTQGSGRVWKCRVSIFVVNASLRITNCPILSIMK